MEKICPLMSRPVVVPGPTSEQVFIWHEYCQKEKCELWTTVWTTENLQDHGCSLRMKVGVNSEGKFVV